MMTGTCACESDDDETLDALAAALERDETVTAAVVHTPQTRADWVELLVTPPALSPALLREIADHDCEVTELMRESSVVGAGPGIGMVSIQKAAQQSETGDDSEDRNSTSSTDGDGRDDSGSGSDRDPDDLLDDLVAALDVLDAVLSVELHHPDFREEYTPSTTDNTRLDEMFVTEQNRLETEHRAWIELVADGTMLSPAILRTIGEHDAGVSEVIHLGDHFTGAAIRGVD